MINLPESPKSTLTRLLQLAVSVSVVLPLLCLASCVSTVKTASSLGTNRMITPASGHLVTIEQAGFTPQQINISVGESVTWTNSDKASHTVTSWHVYQDETNSQRTDIGETWDSGFIEPGESYSRTFNQVGIYEYVSMPLYLYFQYQQNPVGVVLVAG
jgi:plastocyanin